MTVPAALYNFVFNHTDYLHMNDAKEKQAITQCLQLLESRLNWGSSQNWVNYDFEKLSLEIEQKTQVNLSVTTLKRLWGKVKYPHAPTLTTLNTLAQFLGHADWRSFTQSLPVGQIETPVTVPNTPRAPRFTGFKIKRNWALVGALVLVVLLAISAFVPEFFNFKVNQEQYSFKANKILSQGVPNSVIFTYDASVSPTDSVFIVQTWDIRRKTLVPKDQQHHSAVYYYPGFFRSKLIIGQTIVKTHDIQIATDGWLGLVENEPRPIYFKKSEILKGDRVEIDTQILRAYNLPLLPDPPKIRLFNQRDMGDLMTDNFIFETTLKSPYSGGSNACQFVEVLIQCKDDIMVIPLADKACAGDLRLYAAGAMAESKHADLSGFGCNLNEWNTLKVVTKDKKMVFYVNGKKAYSFTFPNDPTGIVGVQYRFSGAGAVKDTRFSNGTFELKL